MSCANHDFSVCRGSTLRETVVYKDALGVPINISGWLARFTVAGATYISPSLNVTVGPEAGTIHLVLTSVQVLDLGFQVPYHLVLSDPMLSPGLGDIAILEGNIEVE